jgi:hypothetical protein
MGHVLHRGLAPVPKVAAPALRAVAFVGVLAVPFAFWLAALAADPVFLDAAPAPPAVAPNASLAEMERAHIRAVLDECVWKVGGKGNAADRLP